jgi:hypothetical protein
MGKATIFGGKGDFPCCFLAVLFIVLVDTNQSLHASIFLLLEGFMQQCLSKSYCFHFECWMNNLVNVYLLKVYSAQPPSE